MEMHIEQWVNDSPLDQKAIRHATHMILKAISGSDELSAKMVMKGGALLGLRYGSSRYTTDIDFSTDLRLAEVSLEEFTGSFNDSLDVAEAELAYGMKCKLQSYKIQPNAQGTFPTVKLKVAYAYKNDQAQMKRLESRGGTNLISIDYSFNERSYNLEILEIDDGQLKVYGIFDLLAEKYRSILQQVVRERNREQDIYDVNYLLTTIEEPTAEDRYNILDSLIRKSEGKDVCEFLNAAGMDDPRIKERSFERYADLQATVKVLPDFEESYKRVSDFYRNLPWELFEE
ncbi:nucleotidyl transferase AbiEii/AbiGii toxin family protein [Pseudomonas sp. P9_35]|uniref:nucleotidyl transferase AbiEii/AbiGii toxin family protein n=1 Tax=unclassified Pseudomonas TaxID=196821 RepID=UPI002A35A238|nr:MULTISPECIES: nucleotidyl transferase AbiEii/AbiGii toxin family protein [unclassified Pseudomonas]WPN62675.1 nucleotidyl transferase AbiEii/AbiGii toxin family protein [Pseudomonas sp. P9_32]WPN68430.1 nucleotidyl transferase AbiEii/AbiGii toxin family protein [Pseudomonas sp. P9_35]